MDTLGYGKHIQKQTQNWPSGKPITTVAIASALASTFDISIENARKITNVNMKRLTDKGDLVRIQRGVYGRITETPFGKLAPRPDEILTGILMHNGENIIGYFTGPTLLNAIGLCSQIPGERHIASNLYRHRLPKGSHIRVYKPLLPVNDDNVLYLQALEAFAAIEHYPVDTDKPEVVLRDMLQASYIDNEKLIWYARCCCGQKMLLKTINISLGGVVSP